MNKKQIEKTIPCDDINCVLEHYTEKLGYSIESIFPADNPRSAIVFKGESRIQLGTEEIINTATIPPIKQSFTITELVSESAWIAGRAGMMYRDLIPDLQGGRFIASHIKIPDGGPVEDYVHYHKIRFQIIYIHKGWVRLVYEDQGSPFIMKEGDCVLQPPEIRHQVLECSSSFEAIEVSCPAEHLTNVDYDLTLPTSVFQPDRSYKGQIFHLHKSENAHCVPWYMSGFEYRDIGIAAATDGLASAQVGRFNRYDTLTNYSHNGEFLFMFVLKGNCILHCNGQKNLKTETAVVIPAQMNYSLKNCSDNFEILEVVLPARKVSFV